MHGRFIQVFQFSIFAQPFKKDIVGIRSPITDDNVPFVTYNSNENLHIHCRHKQQSCCSQKKRKKSKEYWRIYKLMGFSVSLKNVLIQWAAGVDCFWYMNERFVVQRQHCCFKCSLWRKQLRTKIRLIPISCLHFLSSRLENVQLKLFYLSKHIAIVWCNVARMKHCRCVWTLHKNVQGNISTKKNN